MTPFRYTALGWASCGLVLGLFGQLRSPFHLLGHETSQLVAVLGTVGMASMVGWTRRRQGPWTTLGLGLVGVVSFGLGLQAVLIGADELVHRCDRSGTGAFFWATWVPLGTFGIGFGLLSSRRSVWTRLGMLLLLALLAVLHDGLQAVLGVRTIDPFIGEPLAFDQRADMTLPVLHLTSRAWLWLVSVTLITLHAVRSAALPRWTVALPGLPLVLWTVLGSDTTGFGPGRGALLASLDGVHRSEHFVFRYRSLGPAPGRLDRIVAEAELQYEELSDWLALPAEPVVEVLLFDDSEHLWRHTGIRNAHASYRRMALPWWDALDDTFPHELVHTVHAELTWNPALLLSPGLIEGTAMAWDHGYGRSPEAHEEVAAASRAGLLPPARVVMHPLGFLWLNEGNAYRFAGSFMGFVRLEFGREAFLEVQRTLDWEQATGLDLDALDARWRGFLADVDVDPLRSARALDRFDPAVAPGVYERRCPRLGPRRPAPENFARRLLDEGDPEQAAAIYRTLSGSRWRRAEVAALQAAGLHRQALEVLETLPKTGPRALADEQLRIHSWLDLAVEEDREATWAGLYAAFQRRRALQEPDADRVELESLLHRPWRRELGRVLSASGERGSREWVRESLLALVARHPEEHHLRVLAAERGAMLPWRRTGARIDLQDRDRWSEGVALWVDSGRCPTRIQHEQVYAGLVDAGLCGAASAWFTHVRQTCAEKVPGWRLESLRRRATRSPPGTSCGTTVE